MDGVGDVMVAIIHGIRFRYIVSRDRVEFIFFDDFQVFK